MVETEMSDPQNGGFRLPGKVQNDENNLLHQFAGNIRNFVYLSI